jgi:hypothetical protein
VTIDEPCAEYEPLAVSLGALMRAGLPDVGDGNYEVKVELKPRTATFELPIEFVRVGSTIRVGSGVVGLEGYGRRLGQCTLPLEAFEVHIDASHRGRYNLTWEGHVDGIRVTSGGPGGQQVSTWPGLGGTTAKQTDGKLVFPLWQVQLETTATSQSVSRETVAASAPARPAPPKTKDPYAIDNQDDGYDDYGQGD